MKMIYKSEKQSIHTGSSMNNTLESKGLFAGKVSVKPDSKKVNEDYLTYSSALIQPDEEVHIAIIADGMGGYSAGDAASYYAVNFILKWWKSTVWTHQSAESFMNECETSIIDAFHEINHDLIEFGRLENKKIGTTLSVILYAENRYYICHIGDTRIYRFRERVLEKENPSDDTIDLNQEKSLIQLTEDHSWANEQLKYGHMEVEEARAHEKANYLTQCLGVEGEIQPFTASGSFTYADYFLLSTDGFHDLFSADLLREEWCKHVEEGTSMQGVCDHFYGMIKASQFQDDASLIAVNIGKRADDQ